MNPESTPVRELLKEFLRSKSKDGEGSGNYRRNLERCVEDFLEWLETDPQSGTTFGGIDERTFRRYTRELTTRDLTPGTVRTYYAQVSAYIGWCVREGLLEANYAQRNIAKESLPENNGRRSGDQQAWTDEHRLRITRHVDKRAHDAADEKGFGAIKEFRAGPSSTFSVTPGFAVERYSRTRKTPAETAFGGGTFPSRTG